MASTTGLRAIDGAAVGTTSSRTARMRCSQVDESGTHTWGTWTVPSAWPTPSSLVPWSCMIAAAASGLATAVTSTFTHSPSTFGDVFVQRSAAAATAGAISGAAATEIRTSPEQPAAATAR